jgi:hypothetical protein
MGNTYTATWMTPENLARVRQLSAEGHSNTYIAKIIGCDVTGHAIARKRQRENWPRTDNSAPWMTSENLILGRQMWDDGASTPKIAEALGTTKNAICGARRRLGWPRRPSPIRHSGEPRVYKPPVMGRKPTLPPLPKPPIVHVVSIVPEMRPPPVVRPMPEMRPPPVVRPMQRPSSLTCQYTQSERRPWVFCKEPTHWFIRLGQLVQSSYCAKHHHICVRTKQHEEVE